VGIFNRKKKEQIPGQMPNAKGGFNFKQLLVTVVFVVAIYILIDAIKGGFQANTAGEPMNISWVLLFIAGAFVLYIIFYLLWKLKNVFIEWILSFAFGIIIMLLILAIGYETMFGWIDLAWLKIAFGSVFATAGSTLISIVVKVVFKPLYNGLKMTYFWDASKR